MKKLLVIMIAVILCATVLVGCNGKQKKTDDLTTTTIVAEKDEIKQGYVKRNTYVNKSLGISIQIPDSYQRQDFGDLVLTPESYDTPNYDFYIINQNGKKKKEVSVTIEANTTIPDKETFLKNHKNTEQIKKVTLGNYEYTVFADKTHIWFITFSEKNHSLIEFHHFTNEETEEFIRNHFE